MVRMDPVWVLRRVRLAVETGAQDGLDGLVAVGPGSQRPHAGRLQALCAVAVGQADDAETGAKALLGMGTGRHDRFDELGGGRAGPLGPADDA